MQNRYISLWHDCDESRTHIIAISKSVQEAYQALQAEVYEKFGPDATLKHFDGFDDYDMWRVIDNHNEVVFQISMVLPCSH